MIDILSEAEMKELQGQEKPVELMTDEELWAFRSSFDCDSMGFDGPEGTNLAGKPMIHKLISKVNYTDADRGKNDIRYLVKHYVGATGGAKENCEYFYDVYRGCSAHFFVGHKGEIYQCVEEKDIAWHCGAASYKDTNCRNRNSIGVELCVKKHADGSWYYTRTTKKAAVKLFAYLMDKYEIDAAHVLRHYDVTGKICGEPDVFRENTVWKRFQKEIAPYGKKK